jgi:molybdopterin-binding protein
MQVITPTEIDMSISARNQLKGKISGIVLGDVMAEISIRVGQNMIDAIITRRSAEELKLKKGDTVIAVIKATEVMVSKG